MRKLQNEFRIGTYCELRRDHFRVVIWVTYKTDLRSEHAARSGDRFGRRSPGSLHADSVGFAPFAPFNTEGTTRIDNITAFCL